jgi:hypothetical protein
LIKVPMSVCPSKGQPLISAGGNFKPSSIFST